MEFDGAPRPALHPQARQKAAWLLHHGVVPEVGHINGSTGTGFLRAMPYLLREDEMTLRDEIREAVESIEHGQVDDGDLLVMARAILELMDNRQPTVKVKLIRSATKDRVEGWEFSADSNATDADRLTAAAQALALRKEFMAAIDGLTDSEP